MGSSEEADASRLLAGKVPRDDPELGRVAAFLADFRESHPPVSIDDAVQDRHLELIAGEARTVAAGPRPRGRLARPGARRRIAVWALGAVTTLTVGAGVATALGIEPIRTITLRFVPFAPTLVTPTLTTPTVSAEPSPGVPGQSASPQPGATRTDEPGGPSTAPTSAPSTLSPTPTLTTPSPRPTRTTTPSPSATQSKKPTTSPTKSPKPKPTKSTTKAKDKDEESAKDEDDDEDPGKKDKKEKKDKEKHTG